MVSRGVREGIGAGAAAALLIGTTVAWSGCGDDDEDIAETTGRAPDVGVTFYRDAAPILYEHCVSCHAPGGIGGVSFVDYESAALLAPLIAQKSTSREMPPWPAGNSGACNTYQDARWLSDSEITTLVAWADAGALAGDPSDGPPLPVPEPGLPEVSATLDMGFTYQPDASLMDDYRCFVVDPQLAEARYLTGYEVHAGDPRVVHHVILFALDSDEDEQKAIAKSSGGTGYPCVGGAGIDAARFVAGWAPGGPPTRYPEGTGLLLPAGRKMILQIHYNLMQGALPDRTRIDLALATDVAHKAQITRVAKNGFQLPPGQESVSIGAELPITSRGTLYGVAPHMHMLARSQRVDNVSSSATSCVIDVPEWDFHWQQLYFYQQPQPLEPGDLLKLTCTYDTRGQTEPVTSGESTQEEMCIALLYVTEDDSVATCAPCSAVLSGDAAPADLCDDAVEVFEPVQQCACGPSCETECAETCSGSAIDAACADCAKAMCAAEIAACTAQR